MCSHTNFQPSFMTVNLRLYVLTQGCTINKSKRKIGIQAKSYNQSNGVINIYKVARNTYEANLRDSNMSTKLFCFNTLHILFGNRYAIPKRLTIFYQSRP